MELLQYANNVWIEMEKVLTWCSLFVITYLCSSIINLSLLLRKILYGEKITLDVAWNNEYLIFFLISLKYWDSGSKQLERKHRFYSVQLFQYPLDALWTLHYCDENIKSIICIAIDLITETYIHMYIKTKANSNVKVSLKQINKCPLNQSNLSLKAILY